MSNCGGCGARLQTLSALKAGFMPLRHSQLKPTRDEILKLSTITKSQLKILLKDTPVDPAVCQRCHLLKHNPNSLLSSVFPDKTALLGEISAKPDGLIVHITDHTLPPIQNIPQVLDKKTILVLNKCDLLTRRDRALTFKGFAAIQYTSAKTGAGLMDLVSYIKELRQPNEDVYFLGHANVGKSAIINTLVKLSGSEGDLFTTSTMPGTTVKQMRAPISLFKNLFLDSNQTNDAAYIIDTPGLKDEQGLTQFLNHADVKIVLPSKPIKPRGFPNFAAGKSAFIGGLVRIDYVDCDFDQSVQGGIPMHLVFSGSHRIPLHTCSTRRADEVYANHVGQSSDFMYPPSPCKKDDSVQVFPALVSQDIEIHHGWDICFRGVGWIGIAGNASAGIYRFRVHSPQGLGIFVRPSFLHSKYEQKNDRFK